MTATIPKLKRIRIARASELAVWLSKNDAVAGPVMLVTHADRSSDAYVSRDAIGDVLAAHGWAAGQRYTLAKALIGHVISRDAAVRA